MLGGFFLGGGKIPDIDFFFTIFIYALTPMTEFYFNANPGIYTKTWYISFPIFK